MSQQGVNQGTRAMSGAGMYDQATRFFHNQERLILVEDDQRDRFGLEVRRVTRRFPGSQFFASLKTHGGFHRFSAQRDLTGLNPPLGFTSAQAKKGREDPVYTFPGQFRRDYEEVVLTFDRRSARSRDKASKIPPTTTEESARLKTGQIGSCRKSTTEPP